MDNVVCHKCLVHSAGCSATYGMSVACNALNHSRINHYEILGRDIQWHRVGGRAVPVSPEKAAVQRQSGICGFCKMYRRTEIGTQIVDETTGSEIHRNLPLDGDSSLIGAGGFGGVTYEVAASNGYSA